MPKSSKFLRILWFEWDMREGRRSKDWKEQLRKGRIRDQSWEGENKKMARGFEGLCTDQDVRPPNYTFFSSILRAAKLFSAER